MAAPSVLVWVFILSKLVNVVESIRVNHYWPYDVYVQPLNCQSISGRRTFLHCAVSCVRGCQAIRFEHGCTVCFGEQTSVGIQASNLTFSSDSFYLPRAHRVSGSPGSGVTIQLSQPLSVGTMIHLSLTMFSTTTVLDLNSYRASTIVLHFSVRLYEQSAVMNTLNSGNWGGEQRMSSRPYFGQGLKTDIHILVGQDRYIIYLNRNYCCSYMYRLPITEVNSLVVKGNVRVHELSV